MAEQRSTLWEKGRLVDSRPRLRQTASLAVAVLLLLVALDFALGFGLRQGGLDERYHVHHTAAVRDTLHAATSHGPRDQESWLLLGDSVLVGDSVAEVRPDWQEHRVIDYLRREVRDTAPWRFEQVALNGMLLTDMLRVIRELDRIDPGGRVGVVLELNLRMFSAHYAEHAQPSRPWLETLGVDLHDTALSPTLAMLQQQGRYLGDRLRSHAPLFRHRDLLFNPLAPEWLLPRLARDRGPEADPLELSARMLEHMSTPILVGQFAPLAALDEVLHRIRASGRKALLFTPPLNSAIFDPVAGERYGSDLAWLSRRVDAVRGDTIELVHLHHPLFRPEHFHDVAHLYPEGNRLLALNLLHHLDAPFQQAPDRSELVADTGASQALLAQLNPGDAEGSAWRAALRQPESIALGPDGRVLIADTANHVIRELDQSRKTLRTLAGAAGSAGAEDGVPCDARLTEPRHLAFAGEDHFFFVDGEEGERLRRVRKGLLRTEYPLDGESWSAISGLAYRNGLVYLLDAGTRLLAYDPISGMCKLVCEAGPLKGIRAFEISDDGRLFVVDQHNHIWTSSIHPESPWLFTFHPLFENLGESPFPEGQYYPYPAEQHRFENIQKLRYVRKYNGLLIQDRIQGAGVVPDFDETDHLHFLDLDTNAIMPWIQATTQGGYQYWNAVEQSYISPYRAGDFDFDGENAVLYYLERNRGHLFTMADGLWEAAKIAQVTAMFNRDWFPDRFANHTGETLYFLKSPEQNWKRATRSQGLAGPYLGMIVGPSLVTASDLMPHFSLARAVEEDLNRRFELEQRSRFEALVRSDGGMKLDEAIGEVLRFFELGGRLDVALIAVINQDTLPEGSDLLYHLGQLAQAAETFDTLVLFFDANPLFGRYRDGLQPPPESFVETRARIEAAGFPVIDISSELLQQSRRLFPSGSPPFQGHHAAPWTIAAAAELLAARAYPSLVAHFRDRIPALHQVAAEDTDAESAAPPLLQVLDAHPDAMTQFETVAIPQQAVQRRFGDGHLDLLLDLMRCPAYRAAPTDARLEDIAFSALNHYLRQDIVGRRAVSLRLRLVQFDNYDEYGAGVAESAEVIWEREWDGAGLAAWLEARSLKQSADE